MNLLNIRTHLRRRLQDQAEQQWDVDADLDGLINEACRRVARLATRINPESTIFVSNTDIVAGQTYYPLPDDCITPMQVMLKVSASSGGYRRMKYQPFQYSADGGFTPPSQDPSDATLSLDESPTYSRLGKWLVLGVEPSEARTDGIKLIYRPAISLSADTDTPELPISFHYLIVVAAHALALSETGESIAQVQEEFSLLAKEVAADYQQTLEPQALIITTGFSKDY